MGFTVRLVKAGGNIDSKGVKHYSRTYKVESDDVNDAPGAVISAGELEALAYLSPHPDDPGALLKSKNATQTDDLMMWECVFEWDTEESSTDRGTVGNGGAGPPSSAGTTPSSPGGNTSATPPEARPWKFEWGSVQTERLMEKDLSDDEVPVVNSANLPFDPPPSVPCSDTTLTVTLYQGTARPEKIWVYQDAVNTETFLGVFEPRTVRVTQYKQTSVYEAQHGWFWEYSLTFQIRFEGWNPVKVLDAGTMQRVDKGGAGVQLLPCTDAHGQAVTSPVPLDGFGAQLPADATPDDFVYLSFQGYKEASFGFIISDTP